MSGLHTKDCDCDQSTVDEVEPMFCDDEIIFSVVDLESFLAVLDLGTVRVAIRTAGEIGIFLRNGIAELPDGIDLEETLKALAYGVRVLESRLSELEAE